VDGPTQSAFRHRVKLLGAEACLKDPRLKACLVMDVLMTADLVQNGLQQPGMWITRPAGSMRLGRQKSGGWTEKDIEQTQTTMRAVFDRLPEDGHFVQVHGMFHIDLTDLSLVSPIFSIIGFSGPRSAASGRMISSTAIRWRSSTET
jgi:hypothetical protein